MQDTSRSSNDNQFLIFGGALFTLAMVGLFVWVLLPPFQFPSKSIFTIEEGASLSAISQQLEEENIIRSAFWFQLFVVLSGKQDRVVAGEYYFSTPRGTISLGKVVTRGEFNLDPVRITIPEGYSTADIAALFAEQFPSFDPARFLAKAQHKEGYLFPDTYSFFPNVTADTVLHTLERTFDEKIAPLRTQIRASERSLEDIIIMASIIEREARTPDSRRLISGILWKRIEIGMPLQVDVTFDYINGKNTFELTAEDLDIDSPYNTYRYAGLPPGPIGNPSLDSIEAALEPTPSDYLFFLADRTGTVHYSSTFEEHREKKFQYLN